MLVSVSKNVLVLIFALVQEGSANFGYGFAAGLVSGVLVSCGLAGLVAAVMFFIAKERRKKSKTLTNGSVYLSLLFQ